MIYPYPYPYIPFTKIDLENKVFPTLFISSIHPFPLLLKKNKKNHKLFSI